MELARSVRRRVFGNCAFGGFWGAPFEGRPVPSFEGYIRGLAAPARLRTFERSPQATVVLDHFCSRKRWVGGCPLVSNYSLAKFVVS